MSEERIGWLDALQDLGDAVVELVRAEVSVVTDRWRRTLIELAKIAGLIFVVMVVFFYLPFLALLGLVDAVRALANWPIWGAAAAVLGAAVLFCLILALIAKYILSRYVEAPNQTVVRRLDDASGWWHERVAHEPHRLRRSPHELAE
ncbi:MAG: phage holin family protein [Acidobacteriota bacterium]